MNSTHALPQGPGDDAEEDGDILGGQDNTVR